MAVPKTDDNPAGPEQTPLTTVPGGIGDLGIPTSLIVVPGFSTDANGNIVTQESLGSTQTAANTYTSGGSSKNDWIDTFWGGLGLDATTIAGLRSAISGLTDPTQIAAIGQNYLQGTPWFQTTFPGYSQGLTAGLYTDLSGYRSYVNDLNQSTQQYLGRAVTSQEVADALRQGRSAALYANYLQGAAIAKTEGPEAQYEAGAFTSEGRLSQQELAAYGNEKAGIDTQLGQAVQLRLQQAVQKMSTIFQGRLATPGITLGQAGQGVYSPLLQGAQEGRGGLQGSDLPAA